MGFFKNIFGGTSDKGSNKNSPIQVIEETLEIQFPVRFKEFITGILNATTPSS